MPKVTFTGAAIAGFHFTPGPKRGEGGPLVVIDCTANWTDGVRKSMGWQEVPDTIVGSIKLLPDELAATTIEMVPGKGLERNTFDLDVSSADEFTLFIPADEDKQRELRFKIRTPVKGAEVKLGHYGRSVGDATGRLTVSYDEPKQEELPLTGEALAQHQAAAEKKGKPN